MLDGCTIGSFKMFSFVLNPYFNSTSQEDCMGAKSSNIFTCPKKIIENSKDKLLMFINRKFSEHRCCSSDPTPKKKKKSRSRSMAGQRLVSVSSTKKKKKRKKKDRSQKSSKKKCRGRIKKKTKKKY